MHLAFARPLIRARRYAINMNIGLITAKSKRHRWTMTARSPEGYPRGLSRLVKEAAKQPLLALDEERDLAKRADAGDVAAAQRLINSHLRFVIKIARRHANSGLPASDLIQQGTLGLIQAVNRFNPDRGARLATYARYWISAAIQDHVMRSWSVVRIGTTNAQKTLFLRLRQIKADFRESAEGLTDELAANLARRFNTTVGEVRALARRIAFGDAALDRPLDSEPAATALDRLASDRPDPEQCALQSSQRRFLATALKCLSARERHVIHMRYFAEAKRTFEAIGKDLGLTKDGARKLEARALAKLRELVGTPATDRG